MDEETKQAMRGLGARLFAIQAAVMAIARTHQNSAALLDALDEMQQAPLAMFLNLPWPEEDLDKFRQTLEQIRDQIQRR
jgi:hypothetical protein